MKRTSGGQTSVRARCQAPIKSRRWSFERRRATQRILVTPARPVDRPVKSQPVASPRTYQPGRTSPPRGDDADTEAGYPKRPPGGDGHPVPVSRRVSAASLRFSVIRYPPRSWALLTVGLPDSTCCPDPDGVTAFRTRELRPGWLPPLPRGRRCSSRPEGVPGRRLPLPSGQSLHPRHQQSVGEARLTRHQRGFKQFSG